MTKETIGDRIRICREACGYSQAWLANELGVDRSTVFRYENGSTRRIAASTVEKIAELLGTTREYLLFGQTSSDRPAQTTAGYTAWQVHAAPPAYDVLFRESQIDANTSQRMLSMKAFRFLVESDSLSPRIQKGDLLHVEVSKEPQNQKIHLLVQNERFVLRRITCEGSVVILLAKDGSAEILDREKLQSKYQLIGYVTHLSTDQP